MRGSWAAAAVYFASVFALGFALGTLRVLVLLPILGEDLAVLLELPVMLAFSWWVAGRIVRRLGIPPTPPDRIIMGGGAFTLLMLAELLLSISVFGRSLSGHFAHYLTLSGVLGLAGQMIFGLIPLLRLGRDRG